jgi:hypothetical protein
MFVDTKALPDISRFWAIKHDPHTVASVRDKNGLVNALGDYEMLLYKLVLDVQNSQDCIVLRAWFMTRSIERLMVDNGNLTPAHIVLSQHI